MQRADLLLIGRCMFLILKIFCISFNLSKQATKDSPCFYGCSHNDKKHTVIHWFTFSETSAYESVCGASFLCPP